MKDLSNLKPNPGSNKKRKRIGRGIGSGWGKTSGKGHKGQKARSGGKVAPGFEGGQTPLYRRIPKRGFTGPAKSVYSIVNIKQLSVFDSGAEITAELLYQKGLISKKTTKVKILGDGELKTPLKIKANKFSASAKSSIEQAGGSIEEI